MKTPVLRPSLSALKRIETLERELQVHRHQIRIRAILRSVQFPIADRSVLDDLARLRVSQHTSNKVEE